MIREEGTDAQMFACVLEALLPLPGSNWELKTRGFDGGGTLEFMVYTTESERVLLDDGETAIPKIHWYLLFASGRLKQKTGVARVDLFMRYRVDIDESFPVSSCWKGYIF